MQTPNKKTLNHEAEGGGGEPEAAASLGLPQPAEPMVKLARTFREQKSAILRWFSTRLSNGLLEGLNSLFQGTRAKARGYRSLKYGILVFYLVGGRFEFQLQGSMPSPLHPPLNNPFQEIQDWKPADSSSVFMPRSTLPRHQSS